MDNDFKMKQHHNKKCCHGMGFAIFLILVGGIFLLLNTGIIPAEYKPLIASWQMFLIAIGTWSLFKREYLWGALLITIGGFFIYPIVAATFPDDFMSVGIDLHAYFHTYWPVLLIIIGIFLILSKMFPSFGSKRKWERCHHQVNNGTYNHQTADYLERNSVFGSSEQIVLSQNFKGGEANIVFGELIIDLRKAKLAEGNSKMELNVVFGNIIVYVPADWNAELQTTTVMGSFADKRHQIANTDSKSRLIIEGNSVFGGGELRN